VGTLIKRDLISSTVYS